MNKIDQAIAIDIGTSKIAIFINSKGRIQQIQLSESSDEFPCVIYYNDGVYFGNEALNRPHLNPMFLFRNLKCLIGRKFSEPYIQDIRKTATFNIVAGENDRVMVEVCENSQLILKDPTELLSMIVNYAIEKAKEHLDNKDIQYLALAFPPSFNDLQKQELMRIAGLTGIRHIEFYPETTAAAMYYGFSSIQPNQVIMIIDCGAGTCDISLLEYNNNELQIIAHDGFENIGGSQYTEELKKYVYEQLSKLNINYQDLKPKQQHMLNDDIEMAKRSLRLEKNTEVVLDKPKPVSIVLNRSRLNVVSKELNKKICNKVRQLLDSYLKSPPTFLLFSGHGMLLRCLADAVRKEVNIQEVAMNIEEPVAHGLAMLIPMIVEKHVDTDNCNEMNNFIDVVEEETVEIIYRQPPPRQINPPAIPDRHPDPPRQINPPNIRYESMKLEPSVNSDAPSLPPSIPVESEVSVNSTTSLYTSCPIGPELPVQADAPSLPPSIPVESEVSANTPVTVNQSEEPEQPVMNPVILSQTEEPEEPEQPVINPVILNQTEEPEEPEQPVINPVILSQTEEPEQPVINPVILSQTEEPEEPVMNPVILSQSEVQVGPQHHSSPPSAPSVQSLGSSYLDHIPVTIADSDSFESSRVIPQGFIIQDSVVRINDIPNYPEQLEEQEDQSDSVALPIDIPTIPVDNPTTNTIYQVNEKRTYDILIKIKAHADRDVVPLWCRDDCLPSKNTSKDDIQEKKSPRLWLLQGKKFECNLYEGNSKWKKDNQRIRHTILQRDEKHPDTKDYPFRIYLHVDDKGFIQTEYRWDDNNEPIKVIYDEDVRTTVNPSRAIKRYPIPIGSEDE